MPSYVTPKNATAFRFFVSLVSQANTKILQANPTLAAGDVKVSKDGGSLANLTTLPSVIGSGKLVQVDLSSSEMTADNVTVLFSDASGAEWCDLEVNIQTTARQIDDLSYPAAVQQADVAKWLTVTPLALSSQQVQAVVPVTQKVDIETIKTQAVTAAAPVTVLASVGTAATSTAQTGDSFARLGVNGAGLTALSTQTSVDAVSTAVTSVSNRLPSMLTADGNIKADALKINGAAPSIPTASDITTAVWAAGARTLTSFGSVATDLAALVAKFAGITLLARWLGAIAGKTADPVTRAEINATTAGATYNETTDSLQAIVENGVDVDELSADALNQIEGLGTITVSGGSVPTTTKIFLDQGDDYLTANGRQLRFRNAAGSWAPLTGTVVLHLSRTADGVTTHLTATGTVIQATGPGQLVYVDLPHATSIQLDSTPWKFALIGTDADGQEETLRRGEAIITLRPWLA